MVKRNPEHFLNRELAQLEFNRRVLAQAENRDIPLLERLRYLCIVSSNLDEFFEIRVAGLLEQLRLGLPGQTADGMAPRQVYQLVAAAAHEIVERQYSLFNDLITPELAAQGVCFVHHDERNDAQRQWVAGYFFREVKPVLTPIGLDPSHPFPQVVNKSLNFVVELAGKDAFGRHSTVAIVKAPRVLPRAIRLPAEISQSPYSFVMLSSVIRAHIGELFGGMRVLGCYQFRLTRNSDLFVDEEEVKNLRQALQGELSHRQFGNSVRLEIAENCPLHLCDFLLQQFGLQPTDMYRVKGPVNLVRLREIIDQVDRPDLKFPQFSPGVPAALEHNDDLFAAVREQDILLHHPYQSFMSVIDFLSQAAADPHVVAIKQTVYRTGTHSVLMEALINAARAGKEVTVVVELMARFDEEANINWASRLEEAGAQVVYGVVGLKTHAKMMLVIRREETGLRLYSHLGTGNYHPSTARLYTDFGILTAEPGICADVNEVFLQLTSLGRANPLNHLWQAPFTLHSELMRAIRREAEHARAGKPAAIVAKMNALLEEDLIDALYEASKAGVKVDLIVRGVCALKPGVPGLSENIRVRSVVGRFLEHHRIFHFKNDRANDVYLSSADWMGRNMFRRIEVAWPVLDPDAKRRVIKEGLEPYLADNVDAWEMRPDGTYKRKESRRAARVNAQATLLGMLAEKSPND